MRKTASLTRTILFSNSSAQKHYSRVLIMDQASSPNDASKLHSHRIMPHILSLYGTSPKARDFEIYAPNATFEDPLMRANGVKQIKSAFYSISKVPLTLSSLNFVGITKSAAVFSESSIVEYTIDEKVTSPGKNEIFIDNKQHYKFLGRNIDMVSLIVLFVEQGQVVRHEDRWNKKALLNRDTIRVPLVGRLVEVARRGSMFATHALMGFGKDPKSSL